MSDDLMFLIQRQWGVQCHSGAIEKYQASVPLQHVASEFPKSTRWKTGLYHINHSMLKQITAPLFYFFSFVCNHMSYFES